MQRAGDDTEDENVPKRVPHELGEESDTTMSHMIEERVELVYQILMYLDYKDVLSFALTCKGALKMLFDIRYKRFEMLMDIAFQYLRANPKHTLLAGGAALWKLYPSETRYIPSDIDIFVTGFKEEMYGSIDDVLYTFLNAPQNHFFDMFKSSARINDILPVRREPYSITEIRYLYHGFKIKLINVSGDTVKSLQSKFDIILQKTGYIYDGDIKTIYSEYGYHENRKLSAVVQLPNVTKCSCGNPKRDIKKSIENSIRILNRVEKYSERNLIEDYTISSACFNNRLSFVFDLNNNEIYSFVCRYVTNIDITEDVRRNIYVITKFNADSNESDVSSDVSEFED